MTARIANNTRCPNEPIRVSKFPSGNRERRMILEIRGRLFSDVIARNYDAGAVEGAMRIGTEAITPPRD
jgi:hypothetical protein